MSLVRLCDIDWHYIHTKEFLMTAIQVSGVFLSAEHTANQCILIQRVRLGIFTLGIQLATG